LLYDGSQWQIPKFQHFFILHRCQRTLILKADRNFGQVRSRVPKAADQSAKRILNAAGCCWPLYGTILVTHITKSLSDSVCYSSRVWEAWNQKTFWTTSILACLVLACYSWYSLCFHTTRNYLIRDELSTTFSQNITKNTTSTMYSYFSSRMCMDGYWSPKYCDDFLNFSQSNPQCCDVLADLSRSTNNKWSH
jgi:hypothetical protein